MNLTIERAIEMMEEDGGSLDLNGTGITSLPDNLTVGGSLYLRGTNVSPGNVKRLRNGDYSPGRYLYADNILTHIRSKKSVGRITVYVGKIPGHNVVTDGKHYAHCDKIRDGVADLLFKSASDRGAAQYKSVSLDDSFTVEEAVTMYRIITGACRQGSEAFVNSLGDNLKERYTVREMLELTKGQYGADKFAEFFGE